MTMLRVLLTAFQPYERWPENASWLALMELTRQLPPTPSVTTRLYPVDYHRMQDRLSGDVNDRYDFVVLTGQAPGRPRIEIETVALNLARETADETSACRPLVAEGPVAYSSGLPAEAICTQMRGAGIPAGVSRHGGTYLCNAALYFALHQIATQQLATHAVFVHLPLDTSQAARYPEPIPSLPAAVSAQALRILLHNLPGNDA
jgi:pyroglutamyl-peptidase